MLYLILAAFLIKQPVFVPIVFFIAKLLSLFAHHIPSALGIQSHFSSKFRKKVSYFDISFYTCTFSVTI